jgi:hypothetical protein
VRPPEAPLGHQHAHDLPRGRVHRNRQAEPDAGDRGVDPDHAPGAIGERAARVAGVQRGVRLDHVVDDPAALRRERAAERRDDARGYRPGEAVRVADRHHELSDPQALGVAEVSRGEVVRLRAQHGEIRVWVGADELEPELATVDERGAPAAVAAGHDVRRGEQEPVGRDHDRAPTAAPAAARDAQVRHRRRKSLGDGDHRVRIGVERLLLR